MTAHVAIIGAGPAGLMAAGHLASLGHAVTIYDRMPSPARKFLMAGRGGLNITHSEPFDRFITRYPNPSPALIQALTAFPPEAMNAWLSNLGIETFTGSSGRIFPLAMKSSPLLRAWLRRLDASGVRIALNHDWRGFTPDGSLSFQTPSGPIAVAPAATILALGGASWPRLGSNAAWTAILARDAVPITPLAPSNCGVLIPWSDHIATRFAGVPLKRIALTIGHTTVRGEAVVTRTGLEGGAVYALSSAIRDGLAARSRGAPRPSDTPAREESLDPLLSPGFQGTQSFGGGLEAEPPRATDTTLSIDLRPDMTLAEITSRLSAPRGKQSTATVLRKALSLSPVAAALLREPGPLPLDPAGLAARIKALPLAITGTAGLARAISTAGGVSFDALDENFMVRAHPGVFVAGEMLDWDAPTGGYLLQATFATAIAAAKGAARWIATPVENTFIKA